MSKEECFVNELIGYIFAYPDDDYMTMECLCRKLHKHGLIERKDGEWTCNFTEQSSKVDKCEVCCQYKIGYEDGRLDMLQNISNAMRPEGKNEQSD